LEHIEVENRKMLEKLALEYSPLVTFVAISVLALLMLGLALYFLGTIKETWVGSEDGYKPFNTADKILIGFSLLVGLAVFEIMLFFAITIQVTSLLTYFNIQDNPTNVVEYYKIEQKDDLLDLKMKDKYRDLGVLQEQAKAKIVKEDDKVYQVEYQGNQFEVKKEKK
jgi:hypothetical protein